MGFESIVEFDATEIATRTAPQPPILGEQERSCPGLFCPTIASDGLLTRIRLPGGQVSVEQLAVLTNLMGRFSRGEASPTGCLDLLITNRANLQLRCSTSDPGSTAQALTPLDLLELQEAGLAAKNPAIDHLRNIMASPMAGLEPDAFDVVSALFDLEQYICRMPELEKLSAKFSIGLDGGEKASVRDRANDIWLIANGSGYELVLNLGHEEWWTGLVGDAVSLVSRVVDRYLFCLDQAVDLKAIGSKHRRSRKPRLRDIISRVGKVGFFEAGMMADSLAEGTASHAPTSSKSVGNHLLHLQSDPNRIALEIICPLGKLRIDQMHGLIRVLSQFNLNQIRLTPWQTLIIPNVLRSALPDLKQALTQISINPNANHPARGIVACSGKSGCQSAATHTQDHAKQLIAKLEELTDRDCDRAFPTIQISGCEKLCAMPKGSDIVLIGCEINGEERYGDLLPGEAIDRVIQQIQLLNSG